MNAVDKTTTIDQMRSIIEYMIIVLGDSYIFAKNECMKRG